MKVLGHPIHIMLIHFPSALFPMDLVCSFIGYHYGIPSFTDASFYAMTGGIMLGCLAIITGTFDLLYVLKEKPAVLQKAFIHGGINATVVIAYSVLLAIALKKYPGIEQDSLLKIGLKACLVSFMIIGNYIGGSLVLKDKIGIENE